ncbi:PREDICTED: uncharacterized protein LOC106742101 [Dinoponera quadriceps]|uniref:Uncharacterized protein LOC106742101 n=1 Tax=Dinoponera quadriceps TaxID=609295 RepID=A0A6P3WVN1_DINQU|nr:PREDICTED: uncharacterized protein LOC106742101 [Dinoponera quadriceps]
MSQNTIHVIFAFLAVTSLVISKKIHQVDKDVPLLITCNRHQPIKNLEKCLMSGVISMKVHLMRGVQGLNIPRFFPYNIEKFKFTSENQFDGNAILSNVVIEGLTNFTLRKVEVNDNISQIKLKAYFPRITFLAKYDINALIFDKYLKRRDRKVKGNITDISINVTIDGEYYKHPDNNEEYFKINNVPVELNINEATFYLYNKKVPDPIIGHINHHLATDKRIVANEITPAAKAFAVRIIRFIANKMFSNIPIRLIMKGESEHF